MSGFPKSLFKIFDKGGGKADNKGKQEGAEEKMRKYPSDISREEYELIRKDLEGAKKKTRPGKYDLYDVFCAVCGSGWNTVANAAKRLSQMAERVLPFPSMVRKR